MITPPQEENEKKALMNKLNYAGIFSAKNNGEGCDIHLSDYQINLLRDLLKEVLL